VKVAERAPRLPPLIQRNDAQKRRRRVCLATAVHGLVGRTVQRVVGIGLQKQGEGLSRDPFAEPSRPDGVRGRQEQVPRPDLRRFTDLEAARSRGR
jgi:hypothetical protein